jgi:hypothetical protein
MFEPLSEPGIVVMSLVKLWYLKRRSFAVIACDDLAAQPSIGNFNNHATFPL